MYTRLDLHSSGLTTECILGSGTWGIALVQDGERRLQTLVGLVQSTNQSRRGDASSANQLSPALSRQSDIISVCKASKVRRLDPWRGRRDQRPRTAAVICILIAGTGGWTMKVKVISVLDDNYMYLVIEEHTRDAIAVDASVAKKLLDIVRKENVNLKAILTTHHHLDHSRGNAELVRQFPELPVYGTDDRIGGLTHRVVHNQILKFGDINVKCLFTPCHTSGHVCFYMWEDGCPDDPALFSGDTLFVGGCGQFFEGTAEQMYRNLIETLSSLPPKTKVFCGHEYTVRNLKFALKVEPDNEHVKEKLAWAKARDDDDIPTVPSSLEEEFLYNPFMRVREQSVQKFTGKTDPVDVMRVLRKENDEFKKPKDRLPVPALLAYQWGLLNQSAAAPK